MRGLIGLSRAEFAVLHEFEGGAVWWRIAAAGALRLIPTLLGLVVFMAGWWAGLHQRVVTVGLCALGFLVANTMMEWFAGRAPWTGPTLGRLNSYSVLNPRTFVSVYLVDDAAVAAATPALRRVKLVPGVYFHRPPFKVHDVTFTRSMNVNEATAYPLTADEQERLTLVAATLARAGVRARVETLDSYPDGSVQPWEALGADHGS